MQTKDLARNVSQIYLTLVPFLTAGLGIGVGYISYKIYLPIWIVNVCLMVLSAWTLGAHAIKTGDAEKRHLIACASFLIIPCMLFSMFFGLGAPPYGDPVQWSSTINEQQIRYYFLLTGGVFITFGFTVLREKLKTTAGNMYSLLGYSTVLLAMPIFLINMTFWGFYLGKLYSIMAASSIAKSPEWVLPLANQFHFVNLIVCALIYVASAAFAMALKKAGWITPRACNLYVLVSALAFLTNILPSTVPEPLATLNYIVAIPAIPFMVSYIMAINILRKVGNRY